jgi:PAS domain S-box-containing protein
MHLEISVAGVTYLGEPTFLAYLRDITERKRAEEALLQSEKKYRSIFDNAPEGIFQTTPDGRYLTVNPALARMYGYASPEEMMQAVTDLQGQQYVVPEDRVRLKALYRQQGFVKGFETHIYTKSRDKVWISMNAQAVTDPEGNLLYYEGTAENITERKNLEEQLRQAQKMEAVGTLAGGVAHDFIQLSIDKDDLLRPYVDQIVASSERAADLTQGLLAFSRKQRIALEPHKVNGVVASTAKLLRRLLPEDIGLAMSLADEGAISLLDITQINQVLMNLATNAWDAMPHGGSLTIKTERVALDENFRKAHGFGRPGEYVRLSISDTGTGMDERTMERIFEPFFTTKEVGKGTGLGLASAYGIVKRLKGYIAVSSVPFKGTTFDIYLPLINPPPQEEAPAVEEIRRGTETILIVEDDGDVRSMLPEILRTKGYATIEAVDGDGAIKVHREHKEKIDLIILDVVMPGKNGKEALDEIIRADPGVKAIFLSGYTGDIVIDKGIEKEGVDFLQKPLSATALLSKVREVLDR